KADKVHLKGPEHALFPQIIKTFFGGRIGVVQECGGIDHRCDAPGRSQYLPDDWIISYQRARLCLPAYQEQVRMMPEPFLHLLRLPRQATHWPGRPLTQIPLSQRTANGSRHTGNHRCHTPPPSKISGIHPYHTKKPSVQAAV